MFSPRAFQPGKVLIGISAGSRARGYVAEQRVNNSIPETVDPDGTFVKVRLVDKRTRGFVDGALHWSSAKDTSVHGRDIVTTPGLEEPVGWTFSEQPSLAGSRGYLVAVRAVGLCQPVLRRSVSSRFTRFRFISFLVVSLRSSESPCSGSSHQGM